MEVVMEKSLKKLLEKKGPDFLKNQTIANDISNKILESFGEDGSTRAPNYPEHYGGSYINDQGFLVVGICGDAEFAKHDIINRSEDEAIVFLPCKHSYRKFKEILDTIYAYQIDHPGDTVSNNINFCMTIVQKNCIEVGLFNNAPDAVSEFKKNVCDSDAIVFKSAPVPSEYSVNVKCGDGINYSRSVGYRAKNDSYNGFITAGHSLSSGANISYGGVNMAVVDGLQNSGSVDGAWCRITNSSYVPTNSIMYSSATLSTTLTTPQVGSIVSLAGVVSHFTAEIIATSSPATISGVPHTDLIVVDQANQPGDSGGIVFSANNYTVGIMIGNNTTYGYTFIVKASNIAQAFQVVRY
jgi:streptogrisin B